MGMRRFLIEVLAGVLGGVVLLLIPKLGETFLREASYLEVSESHDTVAALSVLRITARNASRYGLNPIQFHPAIDGRILRIAIRAPDGERMVSETVDPAWNGSLGAGEQVQIEVVADGSVRDPDIQKLFSGTYLILNKQGFPISKPIDIRSDTDARLASYRTIAKVVAAAVVLGLVIGVVWWIRKKRAIPTTSTEAPAARHDAGIPSAAPGAENHPAAEGQPETQTGRPAK
jgi:hypothetical protein